MMEDEEYEEYSWANKEVPKITPSADDEEKNPQSCELNDEEECLSCGS